MARKKNKVILTADEIIATLQRSSLPNVVTEGSEDMIILRRLEDICSDIFLSVLSTGGRSCLLQVYERRSELPNLDSVVFIADKDIWVVAGVPAKFTSERLLLSDGYSIENDIYRDGDLERLMSAAERTEFANELRRFLRWYALAISRYLVKPIERIDLHPDYVLQEKNSSKLTALRSGEAYPEALHAEHETDYKRLLRGKSLMALLLRQLCRKDRSAKHRREVLFDIVSASPGSILNALFARVATLLGSSAYAKREV